MDVQALIPEPVCAAAAAELDQVGAADVPVERIRALPVGDREHHVVEPDIGHGPEGTTELVG
jgi:hypothetical protein